MKTLTLVASVLTLSMAGMTSEASAHGTVDDLAYDVQEQTRLLYAEFAAHYSHTPDFAHLMSDTRDMYNIAVRIHNKAHFGGNPHRMALEVKQLDALYHHLEDLVVKIEHMTKHGIGHKHGNTKHVRFLMKKLENDIHLLARATQFVQPKPLPPVYPYPQPYPGNPYKPYPGKPYGKGGVQIKIGF